MCSIVHFGAVVIGKCSLLLDWCQLMDQSMHLWPIRQAHMGYPPGHDHGQESFRCKERLCACLGSNLLIAEQQIYIAHIMVTPALGLIKYSLFLQYYLLFRPLRWIRISVWTGGTVSAVFYVSATVIACVLNSPWPGESLQDAILSRHAFVWAQFAIPTGVVGMLVDWYLLILPIPAIWNLQVSPSKKLGVLIIFMTGGL